MTLSTEHLNSVDQHWAVLAVGEEVRDQALEQAQQCLVTNSLGSLIHYDDNECNEELLDRLAIAYELAAIEGLDALLHPGKQNESQILQFQAQAGAYRAFGLRRVMKVPHDVEKRLFHVLHISGLAYCGDRWTDLRRWFEEQTLATRVPSVAEASWDKRLLYRLFDCWLRL